MIRRPHEPSRKQAIIIAAVFVVLAGTYLGRGWLRESFTPWLGNITYGNRVDTSFQELFGSTNHYLVGYGIVAKDDALYDPTCGSESYSGVSQTVSCMRVAYSDNSVMPQKLIDDWPQLSSQIEITLKQAGWQLEKNDNYLQPVKLSRLLTSTPSPDQTFSGYNKEVNGVICQLDFYYYQPTTDNPNPSLSLEESCHHDINWFGGYSY